MIMFKEILGVYVCTPPQTYKSFYKCISKLPNVCVSARVLKNNMESCNLKESLI